MQTIGVNNVKIIDFFAGLMTCVTKNLFAGLMTSRSGWSDDMSSIEACPSKNSCINSIKDFMQDWLVNFFSSDCNMKLACQRYAPHSQPREKCSHGREMSSLVYSRFGISAKRSRIGVSATASRGPGYEAILLRAHGSTASVPL